MGSIVHVAGILAIPDLTVWNSFDRKEDNILAELGGHFGIARLTCNLESEG